VENPGTSIVGNEPDSNIVTGLADADNVTFHRVNEVVSGASCAANDAESMLKSVLNLVQVREQTEVNVHRASA
jgi:hypothetical protein